MELSKKVFVDVVIIHTYKVVIALILFCSVCVLPVFYPQSALLLTMLFVSMGIIWTMHKYTIFNCNFSNRIFIHCLLGMMLLTEALYLIIVFFYPLVYKSDAKIVQESAIYLANNGFVCPSSIHYFQMFPNNMNIMVVFALITRLFGSWKFVEVIGSILVNLSVMFSSLSVYNLTKSKSACIISFIVGSFYVGGCFFSFNAYTHNYGIVFPIALFYIYIMDVKFCKKLLLLVLVAALGKEIKITTVIPLIAIGIVESVNLIDRFKVKKVLLATTLAVVSFGSFKVISNMVWSSVGYEYDETIAAKMPFFFAMGQSTTSNGQYDIATYELSCRMEGERVNERNVAFWNKGFTDIKERGVWGNIVFLSRKVCMSWGDGTMDSYKTRYNNPTMQKYGVLYSYSRQIVLYFLYVFMVLAPFLIKDKRVTVLYLTVIGVFLYQLIFESQSRYIYMYAPILITLVFVAWGNWVTKRRFINN